MFNIIIVDYITFTVIDFWNNTEREKLINKSINKISLLLS